MVTKPVKLLYWMFFFYLTVHKVQWHSYHFDLIDQWKRRIHIFSHNLWAENIQWPTKSEIENEVHRAKTELYTSHILVLFSGKPRNRKDTCVWDRGILFSSLLVSLFFNFFPKGDKPCLHICFNGFLSKMVWKWMTTNVPFTRLRIIQEYQLELKERNERLENR